MYVHMDVFIDELGHFNSVPSKYAQLYQIACAQSKHNQMCACVRSKG